LYYAHPKRAADEVTTPLNAQSLQLTTIIETLYAIFAPYPLTDAFGDCSWLKAETVQAIRSKPLRSLDASDLEVYVDHVWYCGGEPNYRHFLPRILDLFASGHLILFSVEMLLYDLASDKWSDAEHDAIHAYLLALWDAMLASIDFITGADELLCGLSCHFPDLSIFLDDWDTNHAVDSLRQLAAFAADAGYCFAWNRHPTQLHQVTAWLLRPHTTTRLESALDQYANAPFAEEFLDAIIALNNWRANFAQNT
jgi:hypothetical protein